MGKFKNINNDELLDKLTGLHHKAIEVRDISQMVKSKMIETPLYVESEKEKKGSFMPQVNRYAVAAVVALFAFASTFLIIDKNDGISDYKESAIMVRNNDVNVYDESKVNHSKLNYFKSEGNKDLLVYQF